MNIFHLKVKITDVLQDKVIIDNQLSNYYHKGYLKRNWKICDINSLNKCDFIWT